MALLEISDLLKSFLAPDGAVHEVVRIPRFELEANPQLAPADPSGLTRAAA